MLWAEKHHVFGVMCLMDGDTLVSHHRLFTFEGACELCAEFMASYPMSSFSVVTEERKDA